MDILSSRENFELEVCRQNIDLFQKYINDYESLKLRLSTLPDKTHHEIMVPIGGSKLALMPGYIHHTNEILVLLGDNYFVEKSSKETIEFVDRRIEFCRERISELEKQKSMLEKWLETTENFQEESEKFIDITETCTAEEFNKWLSEHNENLKKSRMKSKEMKDNGKDNDNKVDIDKIFEKYEKLEKEQLDGSLIEDDHPIQTNIVEKIGAENIKEAINKNVIKQRPVSKFKASRNKK